MGSVVEREVGLQLLDDDALARIVELSLENGKFDAEAAAAFRELARRSGE